MSNKAVSYPKGACVHERFEKQVKQTPDAVALVYEGQRLSYAKLNHRANRLAHRLRELGVTCDQLVGLRTERSLEMVIGIIGILKSGGAYLPLDPAYPKDRVAFMLEDSQVAVVVTQKSLAADLKGIAVTRVLLDEPPPGAETNPAAASTADHLAYVIYTSGSTGEPKGALITHYNVTRLFEATDHWYHFDHHDVWTLFHSYAFDFSVWELWGALLSGGRVVIVPYWVSRSPEAFRELLVRERVTVLNQTPSAFRQLIQAELSLPKADLALRYVIFGGEALELQSLRPWFERYGDTRPQLINMYGITETTVHVTYRPIRLHDLESGQGSVIGVPIPDLQVYILDANAQPLPIAVLGELYVGGAGVGRGYLNRPDLTAQRFLPDPFNPAPGARLYRTGDLARRLENGDIEYLGRIDNQVKIRGFRIELGEIEACIAQHPAIREVVVIAREDAPGDKRLVAYFVADNPPAALEEELRTLLRGSLPEYMVPAHFVSLESLPLNENGKVDRKALHLRAKFPVRRNGKGDPPRDELESWLHASWAATLGNDDFGIHVGFFDAGGNSLQAARLVQRLQQRLDEFIYVVTVFEAPTIAEYAKLLKRQYPHRIRELFPGVKGLVRDDTRRVADARVLTDAETGRFQERVPIFRSPGRDSASPLNPPAVFILAPPRSGTTLLRVMLAGHPDLFAAAELQLLQFETLRSRREAFQGKFEVWLEGTIRVLMELRGVDADTARRQMEEYESKDLTTVEFYKLLQDAIGDRLLLEKTPSYALDPVALEHAKLDFQEARFIHLVRHPQAVIRSFDKTHVDQVLFLKDHPYNARQLGELVWLRSHRNILELLAKVPGERQCRVRFEDLLADPRAAMERVCAMLNLPFVEDLVEPYRNQESKMTTGLYPESTPMGDVRFLSFSEIRPDVADSWKAAQAKYALAPATWDLARELGYEPADADQPEADRKAIKGRNAVRERRLKHRTGKP